MFRLTARLVDIFHIQKMNMRHSDIVWYLLQEEFWQTACHWMISLIPRCKQEGFWLPLTNSPMLTDIWPWVCVCWSVWGPCCTRRWRSGGHPADICHTPPSGFPSAPKLPYFPQDSFYLIDFENVRNQSARANLEQAFSTAEDHLGIARLLDPEGRHHIFYNLT